MGGERCEVEKHSGIRSGNRSVLTLEWEIYMSGKKWPGTRKIDNRFNSLGLVARVSLEKRHEYLKKTGVSHGCLYTFV